MRKSNTSSYWKMLTQAGPRAVEDIHTIIARGDSIDLWDDVWIKGRVISRSVIELCWENQSLFSKVEDIMMDGQWNFEIIGDLLGPAGFVEQVLCHASLDRDLTVWGAECLRRPKVKALYNQILSSKPAPGLPQNQMGIAWLWKLHIGPTGVERFGCCDGLCPEHLFLELHSIFSLRGADWPSSMHNLWTLLARYRVLIAASCIVIWGIWNNRNAKVFDRIVLPPRMVALKALSDAEEYIYLDGIYLVGSDKRLHQ